MEVEEDFLPNLASMLEVSLVEGAHTLLSEEPTEISGETKSNIISVNGVAPPAAKSCTETKVADLKCTSVEENETHTPCSSISRVSGGRQEVLLSGNIDEEAKQLFNSNFKDTRMVIYLRLHCTVCNSHIGCTPAAAFTMAFHKFLRVLICKDCESFYGSGDFACGDDGSETFCRWCGQGGHLYCCSICPNVFCKKCIRQNLGRTAMREIEVKNDWVCYQCNMQPLWEHRALCWGLSAFLKEQSKDEKLIPEDVAENSPGYNPLKCCQGEKLPFYRACHPLRPIVLPPTRQKLAVKDMSTLSSQCSEILRNTLTSGGRVRITTPSTVAAASSKTANVTIRVATSAQRPVGVVTSRTPSTGKQFMPVRTPTFNTVSDAAVKLPAPKATVEPNVSVTKSTVYVVQKQPQLSYESAFLSHLYKTGVQSETVCQNPTPGQNSSVTVNSHVNGSAPTNLKASVPLTYNNNIPLRAVLLSRTPNSIASPAVNRAFFNQNNNSGSVIHTLSPLHRSAAEHLQHIAVRSTISSHEPPKHVTLSGFPNTLVPASGPVQFAYPPYQKNAVSENAIESKTATLSVTDGSNDDDDDVQVLTNVQDLDAHEVECKWMMESFKRVNCTSRLFLYHLGIFRQKFGKEGSAKGRSRFVGKYYRLLKKLLERLNVQKEYVSKEFSYWLNAEKAKHGIPTTEAGHSSSSPQDKVSDAEVPQEPELLLDMEITCASDHEDVSDPITEVQQNLIGCKENLSDSDSDSDSDDPFSDCESNEQEKVIPVLKPILSHTVREVLRDKCTRKFLLQLLKECDSKTASMKRKITSSAEEVQSIDGNEASPVKEKEHDMSKLKTCISTGVQTEVISANCSEFSLVPEPTPCSGIEKGKSVGTEPIDSNGKAVQGSQIGIASQDSQMATASQDSQMATASQDSQMATASQVSQMATASPDSQMPTASKDLQMATASKDSQMPTASQDSQTATASQDSQTATASQDSQMATASQDSQMATASQVSQMATASPDSQMPTASKDSQMATASKDSQMPTASQDSQTATASQDSQMATASQDSQMATASQDSQMATASQDSQMATASQDSQMATASQDSQTATAPQDSQTATAAQDSQTATAPQDSQMATASQDSQKATASQDLQTATASQDSQTATASQDSQTATASQDSQTATASQDSQTATASQDSQTATASQDSQTATASQDSQTATASQDSQMATASQDSQMATASQDSQMAIASSGAEGKTINAECDMSNRKYQATKRKSNSLLCTVTPSHMETKRLHIQRTASLVPSMLQRTEIPGTDFTTLVRSAVQKKLIKPCCVSVAKLNRN